MDHDSQNREKTLSSASKPLLSVIIPTRDTRDLTLECLKALASNSIEAETLVVDDGSLDGTADAIRERFPRVQVITEVESIGFTRAANRGLCTARGKIRLLLNSDTEADPELLEQLLAAFEADGDLGIAGCELLYPDGRAQWSGGAEPSLAWLFALTSSLPRLVGLLPGYRRLRPLKASERSQVEWVSGCALAMRDTVWESVGPFDERFLLYAQDLDFCTRARRDGWKIGLNPGCRVMHHHGATISKMQGSFRRVENPERLWGDLIRWVDKHRGPEASRRARFAMRSGAGLRIAIRWLATPFIGRSRRHSWREDTKTLASAYRRLAVDSSSDR